MKTVKKPKALATTGAPKFCECEGCFKLTQSHPINLGQGHGIYYLCEECEGVFKLASKPVKQIFERFAAAYKKRKILKKAKSNFEQV